MTSSPNILCVGSVLWDTIGRHAHPMRIGDDRPGEITLQPGGVALRIAIAIVRFGMAPAVLSQIGTDREGEMLIEACRDAGVNADFALRRSDLPTDSYMAIEGTNGLIAAIADAHSLEAAGAEILAPLEDGRLGSVDVPYAGPIALDGNLTEDLLSEIVTLPAFASADLRIVPASPGKATRLRPLLERPNTTFYLNLEEAGIIANRDFRSSAEAASCLVREGCARVLVTHGAQSLTDASPDGVLTRHPPTVEPRQITGAGDTFMAAHIAAEAKGHARDYALEAAVQAAATFVSGGDTT